MKPRNFSVLQRAGGKRNKLVLKMRKFFLPVLILIALFAGACGGGAATEPAKLGEIPAEYAGLTNPLSADAAEEGAQVFATNCTPCHGAKGYGDGPSSAALNPKPKNLVEVAAQFGDDYIFWRINEGSPGTAMLAWKGILTEEQIWQLVAYIHTLK